MSLSTKPNTARDRSWFPTSCEMHLLSESKEKEASVVKLKLKLKLLAPAPLFSPPTPTPNTSVLKFGSLLRKLGNFRASRPLQASNPFAMSSGDLISVEPQELKFPFELKKQISCSLQLSNKTDNYVAFKVKTTNPKKYCVRPNTGVVLPRSTCDVNVTMQAQREVPPDMQCKDKFLLQCVIANPGTTAKDITPEMFNKESGNLVEECKLRVFYVSPPQPPSPVPEEAEEGSPPRAFLSDNGNLNPLDFTHVSRGSDEPQDKSAEVKSQILRLTEEKNSAIRQNNKLQQELELLKREVSTQRGGGFSFLFMVLVAILGILMGYLMRT